MRLRLFCHRFLGASHAAMRHCIMAVAAVSMVAAACSGADSEQPSVLADDPELRAPASDTDDAENRVSRTHAGIAAAGGDMSALLDGDCSAEDEIRIAYVGPEFSNLGDIGLGSLVLEDPVVAISSYVMEVNVNGGIDGRCVATSIYQWDWQDPAEDFFRICRDIPAEDPVFVINLYGDARTLHCLAVWTDVPVIGLVSSVQTEFLANTQGRLFLFDGSTEYLFYNSIDIAQRSGMLADDDQIGLLHQPLAGEAVADDESDVTADLVERIATGGITDAEVAVVSHVPVHFGDLALIVAEGSTHLLKSGLTTSEQEQAARESAALSTFERSQLDEIESFYLDAATVHRDMGVSVVFSTAPWYELRRMMRAAELVGWHPRWMANDTQGATLPLTDAPAAQAENFYLVSYQRSVGDSIADMDRGCVTLRNSLPDAPMFAYRHHTDAWLTLVVTCDTLDLAMSALTRIDGAPTGDAFVKELTNSNYEIEYGGRIAYGPQDRSGAERFRIMQADPNCLLEAWGCMRAVTDWHESSAAIREEGQ